MDSEETAATGLEPMPFEAIRSGLQALGYSWATAAQAIGRSKGLTIQVANRTRKSRHVAIGLAALLDRPVEKVFGDIPEYAQPDPAQRRGELVRAGRARVEAALGRQVA